MNRLCTFLRSGLELNTTNFPSGDQAGSKSHRRSSVRREALPVASSMSQMSTCDLPPISVICETATCRSSGLRSRLKYTPGWSSGKTGVTEPDLDGGLDLTITEQFARSMSLEEALGRDNLLCYEMNGDPLPPEHGFPIRLIAPGWYGVANVKWLTRIEVMDHRYAGRFMARDYVSIREEQRDGQTVWTFTTVGHDRLKSAPAKVTRHGNRYSILGAAWGASIAAVQVRIDDGPWSAATLYGPPPPRKRSSGYAWRFWTFDWGHPISGEHRITSRAFDTDGNIQPAPDDPIVASRTTYWESNGHITRRVLIP